MGLVKVVEPRLSKVEGMRRVQEEEEEQEQQEEEEEGCSLERPMMLQCKISSQHSLWTAIL